MAFSVLGLAMLAMACSSGVDTLPVPAQTSKLYSSSREPSTPNVTCPSAFLAAVENGDTPEVKRIVAGGVSVDCYRANDEFGTRPLTLAIRASKLEVVATLIDLGARVDTGTLMEAVYKKNVPLERLILDSGASPDSTSDSPLIVAFSNRDIDSATRQRRCRGVSDPDF